MASTVRAIWRFAAEPGLTTIAAVIGLETWLAFHRSTDLPEFAAFPLLDDPDGRELLAEYFRDHLRIAAAAGTGVVLEAPTWRANFDWGTPTRLMTPPRSTGAIAIQWRSCGASRGAPGDRSHRNGGTKAEMREDAVLPVGAGRTRQGAGGRTLPSGLDETAPGRRRKPSGGWSSCSPRGAGPRQLGGGAIPIRRVAGPARRVNIEGLRVEIGSKRQQRRPLVESGARVPVSACRSQLWPARWSGSYTTARGSNGAGGKTGPEADQATAEDEAPTRRLDHSGRRPASRPALGVAIQLGDTNDFLVVLLSSPVRFMLVHDPSRTSTARLGGGRFWTILLPFRQTSRPRGNILARPHGRWKRVGDDRPGALKARLTRSLAC